ncbi:hypothetical protein LTR37_003168 [Vermiconidia calcicola]|uniref:Uncharacterized protein n=1 Tax=Vermiconidia calcicola TaxID=1690605 RepID=A0ACC3NQH6_9PEZI|nr:hypothetical protein LTR37_003168 [Vermiconidia calcicola]
MSPTHRTKPTPSQTNLAESTDMADSFAADRCLRYITMLTWPLGFALLLPQGILSRLPCPAIGIVPLTLSALFGLINAKYRPKNKGLNVSIDFFIGLFLLGTTIPGLVMILARYRPYRGGQGQTMLGAFGCAVFCIHAFFVFREIGIFRIIGNMFSFNSCSTCPHCRRDLRLLWDMTPNGSSTHSSDSKEEYVSAPAEYDEQDGRPSMSVEPRPSTDDETARLV